MKNHVLGFFLFLFCLAAYLCNGDFLPGFDAKPNAIMGVNFFKDWRLHFSPYEKPYLFDWNKKPYVRIHEEDSFGLKERILWNERNADEDVSGVPYFMISTRLPHIYVSTFGLGAGLISAPFFAMLNVLIPDLESRPWWIWYGSKLINSFFIAVSVLLIFLICLSFVSQSSAFLIALGMGLGTSLWSISSQTLWQHGPNTLCLCLGLYALSFLERESEVYKERYALFGGYALGLAALARPTSLALIPVFGLYVLLKKRRCALYYLLGLSLPLILLLSYNAYYFDSPFSFGQLSVGKTVAEWKTGVSDTWQTPIWTGLSGLLFSPSRGLLIFSPVAIFGLWALFKVLFLKEQYFLKAVALSFLILLVTASKWFDWWGGLCYSYRPIVDTMPFLAILSVLTVPIMMKNNVRKWILSLALLWSIYTQVLGAFAYNLYDWNTKNGESIDEPQFRKRLWSINDAQIVFYTQNFFEARKRKLDEINLWVSQL